MLPHRVSATDVPRLCGAPFAKLQGCDGQKVRLSSRVEELGMWRTSLDVEDVQCGVSILVSCDHRLLVHWGRRCGRVQGVQLGAAVLWIMDIEIGKGRQGF
jgi:hypothetical protein